jgi:uncharacterized cupredoxin-like copper-binding protein
MHVKAGLPWGRRFPWLPYQTGGKEEIMRTIRYFAAALMATAFGTTAFADEVVNVQLWDRGGMMMDMTAHLGMGMHGDMPMAPMGIKVDKTVVASGKVTFKVTNVSKDTIHEMLVAPIKDESTPMPYIAAENRVDEEHIGDLGEVSELDPGQEGALTLTLEPGLYLLFCNVPGHYVNGMWTTIEAK